MSNICEDIWLEMPWWGSLEVNSNQYGSPCKKNVRSHNQLFEELIRKKNQAHQVAHASPDRMAVITVYQHQIRECLGQDSSRLLRSWASISCEVAKYLLQVGVHPRVRITKQWGS